MKTLSCVVSHLAVPSYLGNPRTATIYAGKKEGLPERSDLHLDRQCEWYGKSSKFLSDNRRDDCAKLILDSGPLRVRSRIGPMVAVKCVTSALRDPTASGGPPHD